MSENLNLKSLHGRQRVAASGRLAGAAALLLALAGCASTAIDEAERLSRAGQYEAALQRLDTALLDRPQDPALRTAHSRQRERVQLQLLLQADMALAGGHTAAAERLLERAAALGLAPARVAQLQQQVQRARQRAEGAAAAGPAPAPASAATAPTSETPPASGVTLGPAFQKPVALEFREAPLRQVFEALARSSGVNFVFDKDVRTDGRVTVFLRGVTLDEAMRVILATQQLDRKLLNDSTVLVYPNTPAKQREHQELVTRSLFLTNADARQVVTLVRTMAKTRDLHVDERLNSVVVRDTPEVVRMVEQLVATLDLPEPEVMLAVEVMEISSDEVESVGLQWPESISFAVPGAADLVPLSSSGFRGLVANPALVARLRASVGSTNLLANPTLRARNREKARVQIGERLPVFTTTSAVNVGTSASVSYIDVGLKLDVEPTVQLDGDVTIKLALEVSNLLREVVGPAGSIAYQVGTRMTSTTLRLQDGQTQVLAGLINDEDRRRSTGLPGLSQAPLLGRLFGYRSDSRNKTEIVMLITPRIVRQLVAPDARQATLASGTDSQPGAAALRLRSGTRAGVSAAGAGGATRPPSGVDAAAAPAAPATAGMLVLAATPEAGVGETVSVTLHNRSTQRAGGELLFDSSLLQPATAGDGAVPGRLPFDLEPNAQRALVLRVLPAAAGRSVGVTLSADTPSEGEATVRVRAAAEAPR